MENDEITEEIDFIEQYDVGFIEHPPRFVLKFAGAEIAQFEIKYDPEKECYYTVVGGLPVLLAYSSTIEGEKNADGLVWNKDKLIKIFTGIEVDDGTDKINH